MAGRESYHFGEFLLEAGERRLSRAGQPVQLPPKTHDVLLALLRRAGGLVTKRELLEQVWPEACVEEGILAVHISALRKALDDVDGTPFIETVSRSGYRFIAPVMERRSGDPPGEVSELCGRGRAHLRAASMYEVPKALAAFRAAIALDPAYAPAHAGLALACCAQAQFRMAPFADAYADAKAAALRALAIDPLCAAAQTALGAVLLFSEWDWSTAERSLRRALDLDPRQTEAYLLYGQLLEARGELQSGLAMKRTALDLEPASPLVHFSISFSYWNQRRYEETIEWAKRTLALDPSHPHAQEFIAGAYLKKGDFDGWFAENLAHARAHGVPASALDPLKDAYASGGRAGLARFFLNAVSKQPAAAPAMQLAIQYSEIGELDSAFLHLERAIDCRDPGLVFLAVAPQWDSLRADTRFSRCLGRMGLSPVRL
ncbi:MAG TPA: winged helix-turn-helix domain-containing protein [Bryobacteraceae bacterium]|nr:winged helix-turn-helix domain-containing protein [Bryobacteraceae bacterium]